MVDKSEKCIQNKHDLCEDDIIEIINGSTTNGLPFALIAVVYLKQSLNSIFANNSLLSACRLSTKFRKIVSLTLLMGRIEQYV